MTAVPTDLVVRRPADIVPAQQAPRTDMRAATRAGRAVAFTASLAFLIFAAYAAWCAATGNHL